MRKRLFGNPRRCPSFSKHKYREQSVQLLHAVSLYTQWLMIISTSLWGYTVHSTWDENGSVALWTCLYFAVPGIDHPHKHKNDVFYMPTVIEHWATDKFLVHATWTIKYILNHHHLLLLDPTSTSQLQQALNNKMMLNKNRIFGKTLASRLISIPALAISSNG